MADLQHQVQYPPRTSSSSRWPAPGIFVNVEFGVSFSQHDGPHTASMRYTSRNMQERIQRQQQPPTIMMQPYGESSREVRSPQTAYQNPSQRRRLGVRPRENHERGSSAPPSLEDRHIPVSPIGPLPHTGSFPLDERARLDRPLPPLPSTFRLGEPDLPWSTSVPSWAQATADYEDPTTLTMSETDSMRGEDPQRVRDLETLHQAMMTVDSLHEEGWDAWTWDSVGDIPRGPRSLGWAISTDEARESRSRNDRPSVSGSIVSPISPPPPPYVVSQWEQMYGGYYRPGRPSSAG